MTQPETKYLNDLIDQHTQDMTGKIVAVTGTTSGTGYVCARELAKLGATVLLLNRPSERSDHALARLRAEVSDGKFQSIACDLQDFHSVKSAAAEVCSDYDVLDVLCHNAGVMALPDRATKDGYDVQMQTNSISPFLLTKELFPLLERSREARIVNHTSMARTGSDHEAKYFDKRGGDLGGDGEPEASANFEGPRWERYHQSKLANCTFTYGLKQRLDARGIDNVRVFIAHPGVARTGLQDTSQRFGGMNTNHAVMSQAQTAEDGALGILRACADPAAQSGDFYGPQGLTGYPVKLPPEALLTDPKNIMICWNGCETAAGKFEV